MNASLNSPISWRLDARQATFELAPWRGIVDLTRPDLGIAVRPLAAPPTQPIARALGVEIGVPGQSLAPPAEVYVREADLVALYPETAGLPFTLQVYWSLACGELQGEPSLEIDLTVSLQTQQLDVRGRVACESWIATHAARYGRIADGVVATPAGAGGGVLLPHENPPWIAAELRSSRNHGQEDYDYFETAAPSDYLQVELTRGADAVRIRRPLLDEVMEKGVIRRLRCRGVFVRGRIDQAGAEQLDRDFAAQKPRLTT